MVKLRLRQLMKERDNMTAYALAQVLDITEPRAYRLANKHGKFVRLSADMLNRLCAHFDVTPGDLIEYIPDKKTAKR